MTRVLGGTGGKVGNVGIGGVLVPRVSGRWVSVCVPLGSAMSKVGAGTKADAEIS